MMLPKNGVLINTARKEVIDEEGLCKALRERPDLKYVADIKPDLAAEMEQEFEGRVFFTPKKMGAQTSEANINAGIAAANQVVAFLRDGIDRFRVNK
jgi:D-3-phosphoglycerate dehydrogenase